MKKLKFKKVIISIGIICALGISTYGANYTYSNYQKNKAEQAEKQAKEQRENEQREKAIDKVQTTVNNRIINMNCKAEYNCTSTTDEYFIITTTLNGKKDTTIDCKVKRLDDSVDFDDFDSFRITLNKYVSEEKLSEIRHTAIHDYQDMLYGMAAKMPTWDNVHLSQNDDDYIVQETSNRFFSGEKAYLVTIDSKWTTKRGTSEWKHICLHMEYGKDNKLIDAKYYYGDVDPDKDIKNGVKVDISNVVTKSKADSDTKILVKSKEEAIKVLEKSKKVDYKESSAIAYPEMDKILDGVKYYYIEVVSKGGRGAAMTYYVNSQTGEIIDLISQQDMFERIRNSK